MAALIRAFPAPPPAALCLVLTDGVGGRDAECALNFRPPREIGRGELVGRCCSSLNFSSSAFLPSDCDDSLAADTPSASSLSSSCRVCSAAAASSSSCEISSTLMGAQSPPQVNTQRRPSSFELNNLTLLAAQNTAWR